MLKYRADIDGMRALALWLVVIFHAFPKTLSGGFIGVDIFFVISGYLISTILFTQLQAGQFSLTGFYARRVRRIFPALLTVLLACYVTGSQILFPDEMAQLGKHIAAGAGFVANIALWAESGYFDAEADTKPLLHLWSLGIEEQFYVVWPLILWALWRVRNHRLAVMLLLLAASLLWNLLTVKGDPVATFYAPHTRFWELLAGGLLAYLSLYRPITLPKRLNPSVLAFAGLFMIVLAARLLTKDSTFPGWWAMLPVAGSVLIILAGERAWLNRRVLSHKLIVWFGLISFPLYLWHWPLLVFARVFEGDVPDRYVRLALVLLAVLLAWLTYRFIETPLRFGPQARAKIIGLCVGMVLIGGVGYATYNGALRLHTTFAVTSYLDSIVTSKRQQECFEIVHAHDTAEPWFCKLGKNDAPVKAFAYGDSHALSLIPALEKLGAHHHASIAFTGFSGCVPVLGVQSLRGAAWNEKHDCKKLNLRIFEYVKMHKIPAVILSARWSYYTTGASRPKEFNPIAIDEAAPVSVEASRAALAHGLKETVAAYRKIGVKVYVVEDNPQQKRHPKDALRRAMMDSGLTQKADAALNRYAVSTKEHHAHQADNLAIMDAHAQGAIRLNFDRALCDDAICPLVKDGAFLYSDDDHLSIDGAKQIYPLLETIFKN